MFATFFHELKAAKVPVTLKEYLTLMEALEADLADRDVEHFYYLSRAALVKDERHLDKFDQVFGHVFKGLELMREALEAQQEDAEAGSDVVRDLVARLRGRIRRPGAPHE